MLSIEKYKDKIGEIGVGTFAFDGKKIATCEEIGCATCKFLPDDYATCDTKKLEWLCREYEEHEIDWDNDIDWESVPPDTDVLVNYGPYTELEQRKFAIYVPNGYVGKYRTFGEGMEHKTAFALQGWDHCRLVNPADVEKYRKRG